MRVWTRPARQAWVLPQTPTLSEMRFLIRWSCELWGVWDSFAAVRGEHESLVSLDRELLRRFDPEFVLGLGTNITSEQAIAPSNPWRTLDDPFFMTRDRLVGQFTNVVDLEAAEATHEHVRAPVFSGTETQVLWAEAISGAFRPGVPDQLRAADVSVDEAPVNVGDPVELQQLVALMFGAGIVGERRPRHVSMQKLMRTSGVNANWEESPIVFVIGDAPTDFAYYWTLRALRPQVFWLPREALTQWPHFIDSVNTYGFLGASFAGHHGVRLTSRSIQADELGALAGQFITSHGLPEPFPVEPITPDRLDLLLPGVLAQEDFHSAEQDAGLFLDGKSVNFIRQTRPKAVRLDDPIKLRFVQEVHVNDHQLAAHKVFNHRLDPDPGGNGSRAGRDGWAFIPQRPLTYSFDTLASTLTSSHLLLRKPLEEVLLLFEEAGLKAAPSTAGQYIDALRHLVGDERGSATYLMETSRRRALDLYRDAKRLELLPTLGCTLEQRRYLQRSDLEAATGITDQDLSTLISDLVEHRLFRRGFALHCDVCRHSAFYELDDVGDEFTCRRCRRLQRWQLRHVKAPAPELFYGLDEVAFQALLQKGHLVLHGIDRITTKARSVLVAPGVDVWWPDEALPWEVDAVIIADGEVVLMEFKDATDIEPAQIARYEQIARKLFAQRVVYVTTASSWTEGALTRIAASKNYLRTVFVGVETQALDCGSVAIYPAVTSPT